MGGCLSKLETTHHPEHPPPKDVWLGAGWCLFAVSVALPDPMIIGPNDHRRDSERS